MRCWKCLLKLFREDTSCQGRWICRAGGAAVWVNYVKCRTHTFEIVQPPRVLPRGPTTERITKANFYRPRNQANVRLSIPVYNRPTAGVGMRSLLAPPSMRRVFRKNYNTASNIATARTNATARVHATASNNVIASANATASNNVIARVHATASTNATVRTNATASANATASNNEIASANATARVNATASTNATLSANAAARVNASSNLAARNEGAGMLEHQSPTRTPSLYESSSPVLSPAAHSGSHVDRSRLGWLRRHFRDISTFQPDFNTLHLPSTSNTPHYRNGHGWIFPDDPPSPNRIPTPPPPPTDGSVSFSAQTAAEADAWIATSSIDSMIAPPSPRRIFKT